MNETIILDQLAAEIDPANPGQAAEAIVSFLGHLTGAEVTAIKAGGPLAAEDVADVRQHLA